MTWLVGTLLFLAGLAAGLAVSHLHSLKFGFTLTIADILNWVVVLGLARLLQIHWQQNYSDIRVEKDLLIQQSKDAILALKDARSIFLECCDKKKLTRDDEKAVKRVLRNLANTLYFLECGLGECERMRSVGFSHLKEHCMKYKAVLTGGGFPTQPYTSAHWTDAEVIYKVFHEGLQKLIFEINKL